MAPPFVDPAWVAVRPGVVLADVRSYLDGRRGRDAYDAGHLPGAVFVDLDADLAGPPSAAAGRHPLPEPAAFATAMAALGIGDDDVVVAYDDAGGVIAARLAWMLRATGHEAAVLEGGLAAWPGGPTTDVAPRPPAGFTPRPWPEGRLADADDVASGSYLVLDARDADRYAGASEPIDRRAGHIPGAVNVPCRANLGGDGRLLPTDVLRERFVAAGAGGGRPVAASCGSGVTACHDLLVLEHVGLPPGRLYPGSWSQWSADPGRPVATGATP